MSQMNDPFARTLAAYQAAVLAKDAEAFTALYDNDVQVFDMWGAWSLRGIEPWQKMATDWFASLGNETVVVGVADAHSTVGAELVIGHAILTYTGVSAEGKELRSMSNRMTMALKRTGDVWKIIHEHTSAPIDHQTLKAMLQYKATPKG